MTTSSQKPLEIRLGLGLCAKRGWTQCWAVVKAPFLCVGQSFAYLTYFLSDNIKYFDSTSWHRVFSISLLPLRTPMWGCGERFDKSHATNPLLSTVLLHIDSLMQQTRSIGDEPSMGPGKHRTTQMRACTRGRKRLLVCSARCSRFSLFEGICYPSRRVFCVFTAGGMILALIPSRN